MLRVLILALLILSSTPVAAYNFLYIHPTTGEPIGWGPGATIRYYLDPGPLGRLTNEQAHTLLREAMRIWEEASPLADVPHFEFAGYLPEDVTGENYQDFVSQSTCYTSNTEDCETAYQRDLQTVIVFDEDQSFLNDLCITGCGFAIAGPRVLGGSSSSPTNIQQGIMVIGSTAGDENTKIAAVVGRFVHELGHLLGLAHTSINQEAYIDSSDGFQRYVPTMFYSFAPRAEIDQQTALATLASDDIAGISVLYPSDNMEQETASIRGEILKSDGFPMMHVNVIARNVEDPLCEGYSFLSGRTCEAATTSLCEQSDDPINTDPSYFIGGLPPGTYTVEVEEVADDNLAMTLAPGLVDPFIAGDAEFWNEGDQANEESTVSSVITLSAGEIRQDINITLNRSEVTEDRIQYIPLDSFTEGPGTNCPEEPEVDYAALIGIREGNQPSEENSDDEGEEDDDTEDDQTRDRASINTSGCSLILETHGLRVIKHNEFKI